MQQPEQIRREENAGSIDLWIEGQWSQLGIKTSDLEYLRTDEGHKILQRMAEQLKNARAEIVPAGDTTIALRFAQNRLITPEDVREEIWRRGLELGGKAELEEHIGKTHDLPIIELADMEQRGEDMVVDSVNPDGSHRQVLWNSKFPAQEYLFLVKRKMSNANED